MREFPKLDLLLTEEDVARLRAEIDDLVEALDGLMRDRFEPLNAATTKWLLDRARALIAKHKGES